AGSGSVGHRQSASGASCPPRRNSGSRSATTLTRPSRRRSATPIPLSPRTMTELSPTVDVGALGIVAPLATRLGPPRLSDRLIQRDRLMWRLGASVAVH